MNKSDGFYVEPLVYSIGLHMGLQWAILNATVGALYVHEGGPCR